MTTPASGAASSPAEPPAGDRRNPVLAALSAARVLNLSGSDKEVRHLEFSLEGTGLAHEPGDALGVFPENWPALVDEILHLLGCDGEEAVSAPDGTATSIRRALGSLCDLGRPTREFAARFAPGPAGAEPYPRHVLDLMLARPETRLPPAEFVRLLRPLAPRLYSIASSLRAHPGQVHLTVAPVRYQAHGRLRHGVCSTFLSDRFPVGSACRVYLHRQPAFKLPADPSRPLIMVGPGTGIAPFRAFLQERIATGATGRNWLFFGDRRAATDFLYGEEFLGHKSKGLLHRLDLAFSRDQADKCYVQHRMLENGPELYAWLEAGAHFYVCGDAARMAKDVEAALLQVIAGAGGKTPAQASDYLRALKSSRRYSRDVY